MSAFNTKDVSIKQDLSSGEALELQEQSVSSNGIEQNQDDDDNDEQNQDDDDDDDEEQSTQSGGTSHIAIDLSENEIYKGICTLFEDENGNNILEYISLLHSELIGHNKTMKSIRKDLSRIADCAEIMVKKMK